MRTTPFLLLLSACTVVDAPETLEELIVFGFVGFDDPATNLAFTEALPPQVEAHAEALVEGYRIEALTGADLATLGLDAEEDDLIDGAAGMAAYASDFDDILRALTHPHLDEVLSGAVAYEIETEEGDRACFLSGECPTYAVAGTRTNDLGVLGDLGQTFRREFTWSTTAEGEPVVLVRELNPEPADVSTTLFALDRQFSSSVILQGDPVVRVDAFWVDARLIGIEIPDFSAVKMAVKGMNAAATDIDAWVAAHPVE